MTDYKKIINILLEDTATSLPGAFDGFPSFFENERSMRDAQSDYGLYRSDSSQINRVNAFANSFLSGSYIDPDGALMHLRAKLNHAGLDFDYTRKTKLKEGYNTFLLNRFGEIFGTTPTTNLFKDGFDRGKDYIPLQLSFNLIKAPTGKMYFSQIQIEPTSIMNMANVIAPLSPVEEEVFDESGELLLESKDMVGSVTNMIMKNKEIKTKVLEPIFKSLMSMKRKKKLTKDETVNRLKFAAKSSLKRLTNMGKIKQGSYNDAMVGKLANSLYKKFQTMETLTSE
jgi:hypothetical protein